MESARPATLEYCMQQQQPAMAVEERIQDICELLNLTRLEVEHELDLQGGNILKVQSGILANVSELFGLTCLHSQHSCGVYGHLQ